MAENSIPESNTDDSLGNEPAGGSAVRGTDGVFGSETTGGSSEVTADGVFGLAVGLYAASLVAPAVAIGVALRATTDPAVLFGTLLGTATVVAACVGWVGRRNSLAVRLGSTRWVWAAMVLPFGYFAALFGIGVVRGEVPPSAVGGLAGVGAVAGVLVGIALAVAARNRHAKAMLADAEELVRFSAPAPERDCRVATWTAVGVVVVSTVGFVASIAAGTQLARRVFQFFAPLGTGLYGTTTERKIAVTDAGLLISSPLQKTVKPWLAFESYEVTDEAIVVRRAGWSAWGLLDVRRDASEVDAAAVASALGEFLPRE